MTPQEHLLNAGGAGWDKANGQGGGRRTSARQPQDNVTPCFPLTEEGAGFDLCMDNSFLDKL